MSRDDDHTCRTATTSGNTGRPRPGRCGHRPRSQPAPAPGQTISQLTAWSTPASQCLARMISIDKPQACLPEIDFPKRGDGVVPEGGKAKSRDPGQPPHRLRGFLPEGVKGTHLDMVDAPGEPVAAGRQVLVGQQPPVAAAAQCSPRQGSLRPICRSAAGSVAKDDAHLADLQIRDQSHNGGAAPHEEPPARRAGAAPLITLAMRLAPKRQRRNLLH